MHGSLVNGFDEVAVACASTLAAYSASALGLEFLKIRTFDVPHMADGDYHVVVGIEVFGIEVRSGV